MGEQVTLKAADGFELGGYLATPDGTSKGGVVVIQEIFGVNIHIREVCDGYAAEGYTALAPAIFDRVEPGIELGYEDGDMMRGVDLARNQSKPENVLQDIQAAINHLQPQGKVAVVGYCFGGLMTWLAAAELSGLCCASGYYGGGIVGQNDKMPRVPTILHFGDQDAHIPLSDVKQVEEAHPDVEVYVYAADHGFNCDHRASFNQEAADLARERTLAFFAANMT